MHAWSQEWFAAATPTAKHNVSSYEMGTDMESEEDSEELKPADPFDTAFIDTMIPQDEGAIMMARMIRWTTQRPALEQVGEFDHHRSVC